MPTVTRKHTRKDHTKNHTPSQRQDEAGAEGKAQLNPTTCRSGFVYMEKYERPTRHIQVGTYRRGAYV